MSTLPAARRLTISDSGEHCASNAWLDSMRTGCHQGGTLTCDHRIALRALSCLERGADVAHFVITPGQGGHRAGSIREWQRMTAVSSAECQSMLVERSYAVVLEPEAEGGYSVHIPAFRGAHTQGETVEECLSNAREVIELHAEILTERGESVPPSDVATTVAVTLPAPAA